MMRRPPFPAVLSIVLGSLVAGPLPAQPGAFELLAQVRRVYQELGSYRDRGEIEIVHGRGPTPQRRLLRFETVAGGEDAFRLVMQSAEEPQAARRVLWRDGDGVFLFDSLLGQYRKMESLAAGVTAILDQDGYHALAVAALVAGSDEALADPEAAAVEGEEPCGESICYLLALSRRSATIESLLWIDRESLLIRRLVVELHPLDESLAEAVSQAGLPPLPGTAEGSARSTTLRVEHEILAVDQPLSPDAASFGLPAAARLVEQWESPESLPAADSAAPDLVFTDQISVDLFSLVVRVVDGRGNPLLGLEPADFRVRGPAGEVPVMAVDWVSSDPAHRDELLLARLARAGIRLEPSAKRVVFFVQTDMHAVRIRGHLRTLPHVKELVELLQPNDWAAVVSFDSHLKLWQDFTRRHDAVADAIEKAIGFGGYPHLGRSGELSLARHLDFRAAKDAATPEQALAVVAQALRPLDGEKVMIYLGWGLGRYGTGGVRMTADYAPAVRALEAARTTVFVLDVTDAGSHSLEVGLRHVAAQTGGTYDKTSQFTQQATRRLARTISGYYVLTLDGRQLPDRRVQVDLRDKKGRVLSKPF